MWSFAAVVGAAAEHDTTMGWPTADAKLPHDPQLVGHSQYAGEDGAHIDAHCGGITGIG